VTLEEHDQCAMLQDDWGTLYAVTHHPDAAQPFHAAPRADPGTVLRAGTPRVLRMMVRDDHTSRTRAATRKVAS
jgi:hypothetical protein